MKKPVDGLRSRNTVGDSHVLVRAAHIVLEQPDLVIRAICEVADAVRRGTRVPSRER